MNIVSGYEPMFTSVPFLYISEHKSMWWTCSSGG